MLFGDPGRDRQVDGSRLSSCSALIFLLLARPGLKLRRHVAQPRCDAEIKRRSGHGSEKLGLLTQVCTTDHGANSSAEGGYSR